MQLAFSTNAFTRHSLPHAISAIAAAGFAGVEILADVPHAWPDALDAAAIRAIRRDIDAAGLRVSNVNANCSFGYWRHAPPEPYFEPSLISADPQLRADRSRLILATLSLARELGARNISITSGRPLAGMRPQRAMAQLRESLLPILDAADAMQIDVGFECEPGLLLEYADELADLIARINSPRLGANLDIGHSQVLGESIPAAIAKLAGRIWNLHVEDIPGKKHYHLIPGQGTVPWADVFAALREVKYDRFATVELYTHNDNPHEAAAQSIAFLRRFVQ